MTLAAKTVRCPYCKASTGSACRVGRNTAGKGGFAHPARTEAARAAALAAGPATDTNTTGARPA